MEASTIKHTSAVILLNGELSSFDSIAPYIEHSSLTIVADGGLRHAERYNLPVNVIIGDMDSAPPSLLHHYTTKGAEVIRFPVAKDSSDLELALDYAYRLGVTTAHLIGIEGGRSDHLLGIYTMLAHQKFSAVEIWAYDGDSRMIALRGGPAPFVLSTHVGARLSIVPLTPQVHGLTLKGTRWPLTNATIQIGGSLTLSNEAQEDHVSISLREGIVIIISERTSVSN